MFTTAQNTNIWPLTPEIENTEKYVYAEKKCNIPNADKNQ